MSKRLLQWYALALTSTMSWSAQAQVPSLFRIEGDWIPASTVSLPNDVSAPAIPDVDAEVAGFRGLLSVPLKLSDNLVFLPGVGYAFEFVNQSFARLGVPEELQLHIVNVPLLVLWKPDDRWSLMVQVAPALAGDFVELDGDHFRIEAASALSYRFSDTFTLGGGVAGTYRFGALLPIPTILIDWRVTDHLRLNALLPAHLRLIWQPHDRFELGLYGVIRGQSYSLTSRRIAGRWPCSAESEDRPLTPFDETEASPDRCFSNLAYSKGDFGPVASVRLASSLWLSMRVGFVFLRRYEFLNSDNETPDVGELELDNNITVRAGLEFRIPES